MGKLISFLKSPFGWATSAGCAMLLLFGAYTLIFQSGVRHEKEQQAERAVAAAAQDAVAKGAASKQGLKDQAASTKLTKDLTDAVAALPDSVPSARRVALGCARLRAAGRSTADLPQCR